MREPFPTLVGLDIASAHLIGEVLGGVTTPAFGQIEANDPHRAAVFAREQVADHRLPISGVLVGLAPSTTYEARAKITSTM